MTREARPSPGARPSVAEAYAECERITRAEARNFAYGIRLLPPPQRRALSAVYAFARRIDDIGDGLLPAQDKLEHLARARAAVRTAHAHPQDAVLVALTDASTRLPIPMTAFDELVDGCEADVRGTRYHTAEDLVGYCRQVAGSVGRLSLGVFGLDTDPLGPDYEYGYHEMSAEHGRAEASTEADALGVALQLTNILRDVGEDRMTGRVYLPAVDLERFGVTLESGGPDPDPARYAALIAHEVARAERWYADGLRLLDRLDRRSRACCAAMAGIYHRLLHRIAADPLATLHTRVALSGGEKLGVAARALLRGSP